MPREIEIKVRVSDSAELVRFLNAEAEFTGEQHQMDEYFTPPDRNFTAVRPVNEWLRLRTTDQGSSINYKLWHRDERDASQYADESESAIGDVAALGEILLALKFRSLCTVDKIRRTWRIVIPDANSVRDPESRKHGSRLPAGEAGVEPGMTASKDGVIYEIALDREKTLGDFVEVELIGETDKPVPQIRAEMLQFLRNHGITEPNADNVGYPYLLLFGEPDK